MAAKRGLGRGYASLTPEQTIVAEKQKQEQEEIKPPVTPSISEAAMCIADATFGMEKSDAEAMLRMIMRLCRFHLDNGYLG